LQAWLAPFLPLRAGIGVLLRLMRENAKVHQFTAHQGQFQQMQGGKTAQLLCVRCAADLGCLPEVGANKYVINIRFIAANFAARATLFKQDVPFELSFCSLML
jgi:cell division protein ZapD